MTKLCVSCGRKLEDDARFCSDCGQRIPEEKSPPASDSSRVSSEQQDWVKFLGPGSAYYLEQFKRFQVGENDRFALTWNWYPFLLGWLWFLYRKMYLYAAVFAVGPFLSMYVLGWGIEPLLVWGMAAGGLSNYLYYGHVKRSLEALRDHGGALEQVLADVGGVQPYVWWLGVGMVIMFLWAIINPPQEEHPPPNQPAVLEGDYKT